MTSPATLTQDYLKTRGTTKKGKTVKKEKPAQRLIDPHLDKHGWCDAAAKYFKSEFEDWAIAVSSHGTLFFTHDDTGAKFTIAHPWGKEDKLRISGIWPRGVYDNFHFTPRDMEAHSIHVSKKKSVERISADIKRRFLSAYMKEYNIHAKRRKKHDQEICDSIQISGQLAKELGGGINSDRDGLNTNFSRGSYGETHISGKVFGHRLSDEDSCEPIELKIDCSVKLAKKICKLLKREMDK